MALKAVFFGECRRRRLLPQLPAVLACQPSLTSFLLHPGADLDDTLVLTSDADAAAFACVAALSEELLPGVDGGRLVRDWRPLFHSSPWCPHGKVHALLSTVCC